MTYCINNGAGLCVSSCMLYLVKKAAGEIPPHCTANEARYRQPEPEPVPRRPLSPTLGGAGGAMAAYTTIDGKVRG